MRKILTFAILGLIGFALLGGILSSIGRFVKVSNFKKFAEDRLGDLLKARVHVNEVRVGFLDHISLRGLQINQQIQDKVFYLLDVDRVVFKYNLGRLWQRKFSSANAIFLDSPQIILRSLTKPFIAIDLERILAEGDRLANEIAFEEGRIQWDMPGYDLRVELEKVRGQMRKIEEGRWRVHLEGRVQESFEGVLVVDGAVDAVTKQLSVRILLNDVKSRRPDLIPIRGMRGTIHVENGLIRFERLRFEYNRMPVELEGTVHLEGEPSPRLDMAVRLGEKKMGTDLRVAGALRDSLLEGELGLGEVTVPLRGNLALDPEGFRIENLRVGNLFDGQSEFDMKQGSFHLYLERDRQRIDLASNLKNWHIAFRLQGDHLPFFGADLVTRMRFELKPDEALWQNDEWAFEGYMTSDYLILDQTPFPDFQGAFHVRSTHIDTMNFRWGEGYELKGQVDLEPPFPIEVRVNFNGVKLDEISSLFSKPLPEDFTGLADGGVRLRGENWHVEAEGAIQVARGSIGEFGYDQLSLHFYGVPPYLKLKDSRLRKGMRTFYLEGAIHLSRRNLFHDVRVTSTEKILVWSGRELSLRGERSRVRESELEVPVHKGKSVRVGANKGEDESYLTAGPAFRF